MDSHEVKVVSVRLVEDPPLYSKEKITSPEDVLKVLGKELRQYDRELLCVLNLGAKGSVINMNIVSMGTLTSSLVHPREVFKSAVLSNAAQIILVHNHPSGDCEPSEEDKDITQWLVKCGKLLDIPVKDHVIVSRDAFYSFKKTGLMLEIHSKLEALEQISEYKYLSR